MNTSNEDIYKTLDEPDEEPVISLDPGMVLNGKYELLEQIGRGGIQDARLNVKHHLGFGTLG